MAKLEIFETWTKGETTSQKLKTDKILGIGAIMQF
jgi:hypothetical protein